MTIVWNNDDKPVTIKGRSKVWTDDGDPLSYVIRYCPGQCAWSARFEGAELRRGTLQECMAACELADNEALVRVVPDFSALAREAADKHSNFGTD